MSKHHVSTTINGEPTEFLCETQQTMLDMLRDVLGLTGSKEGCASGDCGACTIICDGKIVCSCLMLGVEAEGKTITTIEGIAQGDHLHPVQQKFLEHAALQCGFCTPGFIVAAKALLDENPNPTETEARYWLAGNLCRCTGYDKIIRAVMDAAAEMRGSSPMNYVGTDLRVVGTRPVRPDGVDKVTGRAHVRRGHGDARHAVGQGEALAARACAHRVDRCVEGAEAAGRAGGGHRRRLPRHPVGRGVRRRGADELPRPLAQLHGARQGAV